MLFKTLIVALLAAFVVAQRDNTGVVSGLLRLSFEQFVGW